jgi:hypothetical protein
MTKPAPLCRLCGKPIAKRTRCVYLVLKIDRQYHHDMGMIRYLEVAAYPETKADCAALTNWQVVSVDRRVVRDAEGNITKPDISRFTEWDGESYHDRFFCNGDHAKTFAYVMAENGRMTVAYRDAITKQEGVFP